MSVCERPSAFLVAPGEAGAAEGVGHRAVRRRGGALARRGGLPVPASAISTSLVPTAAVPTAAVAATAALAAAPLIPTALIPTALVTAPAIARTSLPLPVLVPVLIPARPCSPAGLVLEPERERDAL